MGIADRHYMRAARPATGGVTRLNASTLADLDWDEQAGRFRGSRRHSRRGRAVKQVMWGLVALGVFTGGWAIGCAVIGAQYMNERKTFEPPARQQEPSHAAR